MESCFLSRTYKNQCIWGIFCPNTDISCIKGLSEVRTTTQPTVLASGTTGALSVTRSPCCTHLSSLSLQGVTSGGSHSLWAVPSCSPGSHHWGHCCRLWAGRPRRPHPRRCQRRAGRQHRSPSAPCEREKRLKGSHQNISNCPKRPITFVSKSGWQTGLAGGERGFRSPNLRV